MGQEAWRVFQDADEFENKADAGSADGNGDAAVVYSLRRGQGA